MTAYAFEGEKQSSATISWSFALYNYSFDASVPFSAPLDSAVRGTVVAAFARWASVSGLTFNQVADSYSSAIRVGYGSFEETNELGETDYRYGGGTIANDTLIRLLDPRTVPIAYSATLGYYYPSYGVTLMQVMLHEIGHALGLDHTTDASTVMYPYASSQNTDLATGDIQGINVLYPFFTVVAQNPVQTEGGAGQVNTYRFVITRHSDPGVAEVINYRVNGAAFANVRGSVAASGSEFVGGALPRGQIDFAAGSTEATLTISVAGNAVAQPDQGFSIALSTNNPTDSVTVRGSTSAVVLDDDGYGQVGGDTLGVYRFFDTTDGTHFYSVSQTERNMLIQTRPDLVYEGFGLTAVAAPAGDPAAAPVFRFFDIGTGTHFYSISTVERDTIAATRPTLTFEGTAFYEHVTQQSGDAAVYRFFDTRDGTHFYTSSTTERASILSTRTDLHDEGVAFYAPAA